MNPYNQMVNRLGVALLRAVNTRKSHRQTADADDKPGYRSYIVATAEETRRLSGRLAMSACRCMCCHAGGSCFGS